ncbi:hypothetical protein [Nocardia tengchongensis]|uniref:hypothetical protein n=1 Tax=Nocardia tengchongensis TaxID=2055889 RepID=UPI00361DF524
MAQPAPLQPTRSQLMPDPLRRSARTLKQTWPYAVAAVGSSILFFMMFQPWMRASGWDGMATVNAFGRITRTSSHLNLWSQAAPPGTKVNGVWAIFATIAILVVVFAAIQAIVHGSDAAGTVTAVAAVVLAVLVLVDVLNLDNSIPKVQASLGMGKDLGPQIGLVLNALRGKGSYPWPGEAVSLHPAGLTSWAFAAIAVAFVSAALAVTRAWQGGLREIVAFVSKLA